MTTLHDTATDDLPIPTVLDPTLVLSAGVLEIAYQYYLSDLLGDQADDPAVQDAITHLQDAIAAVHTAGADTDQRKAALKTRAHAENALALTLGKPRASAAMRILDRADARPNTTPDHAAALHAVLGAQATMPTVCNALTALRQAHTLVQTAATDKDVRNAHTAYTRAEHTLTLALGKRDASTTIRLLDTMHALRTTTWSITDAGALALPGSDGTTTYVVDATVCIQQGVYRTSKKGKVSPALCKGWQFSGGACYHRLAFELLAIAQGFETT